MKPGGTTRSNEEANGIKGGGGSSHFSPQSTSFFGTKPAANLLLAF